jgi:hypothetical protein
MGGIPAESGNLKAVNISDLTDSAYGIISAMKVAQ